LTAVCQQVKDAVTGRVVNDLITQEQILAELRDASLKLPEEVETADICV
jgi:hypothetical protein